jgi:anhydro-N-acetylmuramic acid kinase
LRVRFGFATADDDDDDELDVDPPSLAPESVPRVASFSWFWSAMTYLRAPCHPRAGRTAANVRTRDTERLRLYRPGTAALNGLVAAKPTTCGAATPAIFPAASGKLGHMNASSRLIIGAMSGTSADGVDAALVRVDGRGIGMKAALLGHAHEPYAAESRAAIFAARGSGPQGQQIMLASLAQLARDVALTYAAAVQKVLALTGVHANQVSAIAAHGQTLFHAPPNTIQWIDPALLAAEVGCAVVSDFRRADLAAGGQGAPLVPFADYVLFRHPTKNRVLLNLGGIANITWLPAGGTPLDVIAFDTGPANCVVDELARRAGIAEGFDRDGLRSLTGHAGFNVAYTAIRQWKQAFNPPPKSTDVPEMIAAYDSVRSVYDDAPSTADEMATACVMAALGVGLAHAHLPGRPDEIIASGGGVRNPRLMEEIRVSTKAPVRPLDELGVSSEAKEAVAFALLAAATLDGEPSNVPAATGARRPVVLGSITPKP